MMTVIKTFAGAVYILTLLLMSPSIANLRILTSFYPAYITAINITNGAHGVQVSNLVSNNTGCLHDYSLTANDMKKIASADVLVINGAGMENFAGKAKKVNKKLIAVDLSKNIILIDNNPHVWLSIPLLIF